MVGGLQASGWGIATVAFRERGIPAISLVCIIRVHVWPICVWVAL